jgi:hypothetical protein
MTDGHETESEILEINLEPVGSHSARGALLGAVVGAGGGPLYQFVAAAPHVASRHPEHAAIGTTFPLEPFQDLDDETDNEWTALARERLREFDTELQEHGWRRLSEQGPHWWSFRYMR